MIIMNESEPTMDDCLRGHRGGFGDVEKACVKWLEQRGLRGGKIFIMPDCKHYSRRRKRHFVSNEGSKIQEEI